MARAGVAADVPAAALAPHLVFVVTHGEGIVLAQRQVDDNYNEITAVQPLLGDVDLAGVKVTADAIHKVAVSVPVVSIVLCLAGLPFATLSGRPQSSPANPWRTPAPIQACGWEILTIHSTPN